ncbi:malate synthase G [Leucobacter aridicollis]|uniref:malate synthase G n=1 Tax=Leucobacter aridicollis TaxID=283878 RepID=UPI000E64C38E|nr:malate synthase G [Leucobacter aridicollis]UTX54179.1 malate synthase G [Leucobacter aridicollis]
MTPTETRAGLAVATPIVEFAEEALAADRASGGAITDKAFWEGAAAILADLTPENERLLARRDELQAKLDEYHTANPGQPEPAQYRAFLTEIGYVEPEPAVVTVTTDRVDPEIARLAGPQLVVPLLNARFALNAVNARWGSLYDALYGTDAISREGELAPGNTYNAARGAAVIAEGRRLLDAHVALANGSHVDATGYSVVDGALIVTLKDGSQSGLADPGAFAGYRGDAAAPERVLLTHNGLHIDIVVDRTGTNGATDAAGIDDIELESALTTIMDLEDSVAAVDGDDKALGYRNWRGLMDGTLAEQVSKGGETFTRTANPDREYTGPNGEALVLPGRSLLFVRNVGHLMRTPAAHDAAGAEVFEGILDAIMTAVGSLAELRGSAKGRNSRAGSMYIVKPKMHGSAEVAFAAKLFGRVEELLGLPANTLKIGIMDEERRTSANLAACIAAARERVVFINTGFLDRTGDEIHTSMRAGAMLPKGAIREQPWLPTYEARNVAIGVDCGLDGRAQIGKGMWAMPDLMAAMLDQKIGHVRAGASTAWVPSPTAATLHALHYHQQDAFVARRGLPALAADSLETLLTIPLAPAGGLTPEIVATEVENNVQSILGYVVRWIDQGVGCSKVPDIHDVGLMEDRATLRISSQLLANWLLHDVITPEQVDAALERCAEIVDRQNAADGTYEPLVGGTGTAYEAARRLILEGAAQPNGYTEPLLHALRLRKKAELAGA